MHSAGYSGTPLAKKLGITDGMKIHLINAPSGYFQLLGRDLSSQIVKKKEIPALVHLFSESHLQFEKQIIPLISLTRKNPALIIWVSWFKKSSGMSTDLSEDRIRDFALRNNLVDVKVCAIDEKWSALKLVVPLSKRKSAYP